MLCLALEDSIDEICSNLKIKSQMKTYIFLLLITFSVIGCNQNKTQTYSEEIEAFQYKLNIEFSDKKTSPLTESDFKSFKKLNFFPIDKKYKITAQFERTPNEPIFEMPTTTDRLPLYTQYGIATFTLDGKKLTLRIYQNQELILDPQYSNHLFIAFTDLTNGKETYNGGRYIDLEIPEEDAITIDFNKAYNPYCAYNHEYSCPIPPKENDLDIEIKAGILAFKNH